MITVNQLMQDKGDLGVITISPDATVMDALNLMAEKNVGALVIADQDHKLGIFTERDFARKIVEKGSCMLDSPLVEFMTREMITVHPEQTLEECMALMMERRIRHLPVVSADRMIGMVSIRDVVQALIEKKDQTIESLESYITGTDYGR